MTSGSVIFSLIVSFVGMVLFKVALDATMAKNLTVFAAIILGVTLALVGLAGAQIMQWLALRQLNKAMNSKNIHQALADAEGTARLHVSAMAILFIAAFGIAGRLVVFGFSKELSNTLKWFPRRWFSTYQSDQMIFYAILIVPIAIWMIFLCWAVVKQIENIGRVPFDPLSSGFDR